MKELLRKKSVKISILLIILLVVMGIVGINVRSAQKSKEYKAHIAAAEKYLSELDYEQAIAEYIMAFEIDPKEEVVDVLEQTYLAYAQACIDEGDYEKAVSILEEGYEVIRRESLQNNIAEVQVIQKEMRAQEAILQEQKRLEEEQKRQEEEQRASGMIEFPFQMTDITVMGYDLFGDCFTQLEELFRAEGEVLWQESEGGYPMASIRISNDRLCDINTSIKMPGEIRFRSIQVMHKCDDALFYRDWIYSIDDGRDGPHATLSIGSTCEARHTFGYAELNVPVKSGETYEDWCWVMQVDRIKENNLRPEERDGVVGVWKEGACIYDTSWCEEYGYEVWCFSTEQHQGIYTEYDRDDGGKEYAFYFFNPSVYGGREGSSIRGISTVINADGIIKEIQYTGRPITE